MFKQIPGSEAARLRVMEQELYRVYATHLSRLYRRSDALANRGKMPIWIASLGYPVAKHESVMLDEVRINDASTCTSPPCITAIGALVAA